MERAIYIVGAVLGSLYSLTLMPSYETDDFIDRAFTGCVMFATILCIGAVIFRLLPTPDEDEDS